MREEYQQTIASVCAELFGEDVEAELTRPEEQFGDYSTNIAMKLAGRLGRNPREVAQQIIDKLDMDATIAGPGFINIRIPDQQLYELAKTPAQIAQPLQGETIVFEYSDPNPFKVLHAGHLYQTMVGDAIANILEAAGAIVHRVNFGGDVGMHVGKTMWAILDTLAGGDEVRAYNELQQIAKKPLDERSAWLSEQYIKGTNAYETSEEHKAQIITINKRVYEVHAASDHQSNFAKIYRTARQWSYDYFNAFYEKIGSGFEKYYPESETAPIGLQTVREQLRKGVYEESDGAVVFKGEPYGLHTRVFINSEGLPTYEAKDVGLIMKKQQDYPDFARTIIITGNDIIEYMKVVLKSIEQFAPDLVKRTAHLTHGQVKLAGGVKMSSRKGNILRAQDVLDAAAEAGKHLSMEVSEDIVLGAVKYAFVKQTMGPDVIYDPEESISIHGNSGPYLQYSLVRARAILAKVASSEDALIERIDLDSYERSLARKLGMYDEAFDAALRDYSPHHIAGYLYELAQIFNRFYENSRVEGDPREQLRTNLVKSYEKVLAHGLGILGLPTPEKM